MISCANRGRDLEEFLSYANMRYRHEGEAIVWKVPTAFLPIRNRKGQVVSCKVEGKSCVDYLGRVGNRPLAMEAKRTKGKSIRWDEVQDHQAAFLDDFTDKNAGIGLVVISFDLNSFYAIPWAFWSEARDAWKEAQRRGDKKAAIKTIMFNGQKWTTNGKASVKEDELLPAWEVKMGGRIGLDYLREYI